MSNRTDFGELARELVEQIEPAQRFQIWKQALAARIESDLHDAYAAGQEGHGCECSSCRKLKSHWCSGCGHEKHAGRVCSQEDTNWTCFCKGEVP